MNLIINLKKIGYMIRYTFNMLDVSLTHVVYLIQLHYLRDCGGVGDRGAAHRAFLDKGGENHVGTLLAEPVGVDIAHVSGTQQHHAFIGAEADRAAVGGGQVLRVVCTFAASSGVDDAQGRLLEAVGLRINGPPNS